MKNSLLISIILLLVACASNNSKKKEEVEEKRQPREWQIEGKFSLGKYVYVDSRSVVHSVLNGVGCGLPPVLNEENMGDLGMSRIRVDTLKGAHIKNCCRICVPDDLYEVMALQTGLIWE